MTPPNPTSSRPRDPLAMLRPARLARGLKKDLFREIEILVGSAKYFLDSWFESEELKALLCGQAVIGTFAGPRTPGTAYVLFHHVMGEVDGMRGCWGVVRGGMGQGPERIAKAPRTTPQQPRLQIGSAYVRPPGPSLCRLPPSASKKLSAPHSPGAADLPAA